MGNEALTRIEELIKENKLTANKVAVGCKLQSNAFTHWKNGKAKPSIDALIKIANYFNVSLDYLVGRETPINNTNIENKATSDPLLNKIAQLDELQRAKVEAYVDGLQTTTKELFNQGRLIAREKQLAEENIKEKKQI